TAIGPKLEATAIGARRVGSNRPGLVLRQRDIELPRRVAEVLAVVEDHLKMELRVRGTHIVPIAVANALEVALRRRWRHAGRPAMLLGGGGLVHPFAVFGLVLEE